MPRVWDFYSLPLKKLKFLLRVVGRLMMNMEFEVKSISRYFLSIVMFLSSTTVMAEWMKIANGNLLEPEQYIETSSVKQTGPMAIYRQVSVLSQGPGLLAKDFSSRLSIYEYDCMNSKLRVLQSSEFSGAWASGEKIVLQTTLVGLKEWHDLPPHALGQTAFDILCPGSKAD